MCNTLSFPAPTPPVVVCLAVRNARICDSPGFLSLVVQRATSTDEPTLATAYMGLLYRLTFRMSGNNHSAPGHLLGQPLGLRL